MEIFNSIKNLFLPKVNKQEEISNTITPSISPNRWLNNAFGSTYSSSRRNSFIHNCISYISTQVTKYEFGVYDGKDSVEDEVVNRFISNEFIKKLTAQYLINGEVFIGVDRNSLNGRVNGLDIINRSSIHYDGNSYKVNIYDKISGKIIKTKHYTPNDMIFFTNAIDGGRGNSVYQVCASEIDMIEKIDNANHQSVLVDSYIRGIIKKHNGSSYKGESLNHTKEEIEAMSNYFRSLTSGSQNTGKFLFLNDKDEFVKFDKESSDMNWEKLRTEKETHIANYFGLPYSLFKDSTNIKYSNATEYSKNIRDNSIKPILVMIQDKINESGIIKKGVFKFSFGTDDKVEEIVKLYESGIITKNEARAKILLSEVDDGNEFRELEQVIAMGAVQKPKEEENSNKKVEIAKQEILNDDMDIDLEDTVAIDEDVTAFSDEYYENQANKFDFNLLSIERQEEIIKSMVQFYGEERKHIVSFLKGVKTEDDLKTLKDRLFSYMDEEQRLALEIYLLPYIREFYEIGHNETMKELESLGGKNIHTTPKSKIEKSIKEQIRLLASSHGKTKSEKILDIIGKMMSEGRSIGKMTKKVTEYYKDLSKKQARTIVRTEALTSANQAKSELYKENSDIVEAVEWYSTLDERLCEHCGPMHGVVVGLGKNFYYKGEKIGNLKLNYRDIDSPPLHPNCRCVLRAVLKY